MFDFEALNLDGELGPPHDAAALERVSLDALVTEIPRGPALTLAPGTAVASAVEAMRARRRGGVIVVQNHRPIGVVTDRDILGRVRAEVEDLRVVPLADVMVPCPAPLRDTDSVAHALRMMCRRRQWHQPIVCNRGLILGALDLADISLWLRDRLMLLSVHSCFAHGHA